METNSPEPIVTFPRIFFLVKLIVIVCFLINNFSKDWFEKNLMFLLFLTSSTKVLFKTLFLTFQPNGFSSNSCESKI